ncbi:MAG TPA: DNA starvation/stationary phase protection protein Dps [Planktothrix sp.]|jgi:starvation-inducible DNA-binding protein
MTAVKTPQRTYTTRIDLPVETRKKAIDLLNKSLAATVDIWTQTKFAHWNVKGQNFYQLHLLFDEIAGELYEYIDLQAERVTTLGGTALGTLRMAAENTPLKEYNVEAVDGSEHLPALADQLAAFAKLAREGIATADDLDDADTADLYTEISRKVDMRLWFLDAHMQKR